MKLQDFIQKARDKGLDDDQIKQRLVAHGWDPDVVEMALSDSDDDLSVPLPPSPDGKEKDNSSLESKPTTQTKPTNTSLTYSLEYLIMLFSLWFSAVGAGGILHNIIDYYWGEGGGDLLSPFFAACLIVAGPIYLGLYIATKKEEARDTSVLASNARKLMIPLTIVIAFLVGITHLIMYVINLLTYHQSYDYPWSNFLQMMVTLLIAGGICWQYWRELRRISNQSR